MAKPLRTNLNRAPHQNRLPPRWNSWLCLERFFVRKTMTRMLVVAMRMRTTQAKIVRFSFLKLLSQMKIQARLSMKFRDKVTVTVGVKMWGLR